MKELSKEEKMVSYDVSLALIDAYFMMARWEYVAHE